MYLLVTSRKGISSLQLSKEIGVTQKTAWFMLHRLREACDDDMSDQKPPAVLDRMADKVLSYRPKPKSGPAKKRQRKKKKAERESNI